MGDTSIEWASKTLNLVNGCSRPAVAGKADPTCDGCYAITWAGRKFPHGHYDGLVRVTEPQKARSGATRDWSGRVNVREDLLDNLPRWRKPQRVFVSSIGDTFHDKVPEAFLFRMLDVFLERYLDGQPSAWLLLTKRAKRQADVILSWMDARGLAELPPTFWPIVSAGTQAGVDERVPHLLRIPAKVRGLSIEPLLEGVDLHLEEGGINWVITGGESGPKARPTHPYWFGRLLAACALHGVPFFFKQWGAWAPYDDLPPELREGRMCAVRDEDRNPKEMVKVGKGVAGRRLADRVWSEYPAAWDDVRAMGGAS